MHKLPYILLGSGFLIVAIGLGSLLLLPYLLTLSQPPEIAEMALNSSANFKDLFNSPLRDLSRRQTLFKIRLFNVQNPENVSSKGVKPIINEVGPFTYRVQKTRKVISEDEVQARFHDHLIYQFVPQLSGATEKDIVTIINVPWVGLGQEMSKMSSISRLLVMGIASKHNESVFSTKPAEEFLFKGYYNDIMATFSSITGETYMPNNTFGLFYGKNNSYEDMVAISTRQDNFASIISWKNQTKIDLWNAEGNCNNMEGVGAWDLFPPGINLTRPLALFAPDMCRHFQLKFKEPIQFEQPLLDAAGESIPPISGLRFHFPQSEYQGFESNPNNLCYCTQQGTNYKSCPKDGAYQFNTCSKGASIYLSNPHFLDGDEEYLTAVEGLHPIREKHESFVDIEPVTGVVLKYAKRTQVNLHLRRLRMVSEFKRVPNVLFPVMWTEEVSEIDPGTAYQLSILVSLATSSLVHVSSMGQLVGLGLCAAGVVMFFVGFIIMIVRFRKKKYHT